MADAKAPRLRVPALPRPFHVALLSPEIPQNTGSIARLCAATGSPLHLVGRLGFRIDEKSVRRAGVDYWHLVDVHQHLDLAHLAEVVPRPRWRLFSALAETSYTEAGFQPGDVLLFGPESTGLPEDLLAEHPGAVFGIPTSGAVRSLNLSNAVGIVLFEAIRQAGGLVGARRQPPAPEAPQDAGLTRSRGLRSHVQRILCASPPCPAVVPSPFFSYRASPAGAAS